MKRCYANAITHKDGTLSGIYSVSMIERICIFTDSLFIMSGYYEAEKRELIELLFLFYAMPDGLVPRRIFERCCFSFVGFSRAQIDDVMQKLRCYSFIQCRVLADGKELEDYPLYENRSTREILSRMPEYVKEAARKYRRKNEYNLSKMTVQTKEQNREFNEAYHQCMKRKRLLIK